MACIRSVAVAHWWSSFLALIPNAINIPWMNEPDSFRIGYSMWIGTCVMRKKLAPTNSSSRNERFQWCSLALGHLPIILQRLKSINVGRGSRESTWAPLAKETKGVQQLQSGSCVPCFELLGVTWIHLTIEDRMNEFSGRLARGQRFSGKHSRNFLWVLAV